MMLYSYSLEKGWGSGKVLEFCFLKKWPPWMTNFFCSVHRFETASDSSNCRLICSLWCRTDVLRYSCWCAVCCWRWRVTVWSFHVTVSVCIWCRNKERGNFVRSSNLFRVFHGASSDRALPSVSAQLLSTAWRWTSVLDEWSRKLQWVSDLYILYYIYIYIHFKIYY